MLVADEKDSGPGARSVVIWDQVILRIVPAISEHSVLAPAHSGGL
jgi:hypothetical protein